MMDSHVREYYCTSSDERPNEHFHRVIALHEKSEKTYEELHELVPDLQKGWFELSQLPIQDRVDFTKEFWISKLPFNPRFAPFIDNFFQQIEDIGIFLVQHKFADPFEVHMIYCLKNKKGFFKGLPPASDQKITELNLDFPGIVFPNDYVAFLQIHNGFSKTTDTGIFKSDQMKLAQERLIKMITAKDSLLQTGKQSIDPKELIPFYESFGLPFYQCFWTSWYPEDEMGNVYYSSTTNQISCLASKTVSTENMAFATFSDWLMFYLETFDV